MTVSVVINRSEQSGNGSSTIFTVPFTLLDQDEVVVYVGGVLQTIATHYSVSDLGGPSFTVTFVTPPPAGSSNVIFQRDVTLTQEVDYQEGENFPAEVQETALDRLTLMVQDTHEKIARALVKADTATWSASLVIPIPAASQFLRWNAAATALETVDLVSQLSVAAVSGYIATLLDDVDATAARTTLGLGTSATLDVGTTANKVVQLDGSGRLPAVDGSQLTGLATAPNTDFLLHARGVY
jgi:hypothetical protein